MANRPAEGDDAPAVPSAGAGRDVSRRRSRRAAVPQTGRVHHLGLPPAAQPVHTPSGPEWTRTADVRLRALTEPQLDELATRLRAEMGEASDRLDYERAAELLADLRAVERYAGR